MSGRAVLDGFVFVNNESVTKKSFKVKESDIVTFDVDAFFEHQENEAIKNQGNSDYFNEDVKIIYENENLMIINKPRNLTTHSGAGNRYQTLSNHLRNINKTLSDVRGNEMLGVVHRLDKDTSGLMIVAKNNMAHIMLSGMIANKEIDRQYLAICYNTPMPRSGTLNTLMYKDNRDFKKYISDFTQNEDQIPCQYKHAITHYKTVKLFYNDAISLINFNLETGRTHQIRSNALLMGHSLVGDALYNDNNHLSSSFNKINKFQEGNIVEIKNKIKAVKTQMLHSSRICFIEPVTKEKIDISIGLNEDMQNLIGENYFL